MKSAPGTTIRTMDMLVLDKVFDMGDGYVLNFSNRTFADFFREELQVDIDHPRLGRARRQQGETPALLPAVHQSKNGPRYVDCALGVSRSHQRHS